MSASDVDSTPSLVRRPWPRLPAWFWAGVAVATIGFVALLVVILRIVGEPRDQPLFARRTPPGAAESHDVGKLVLSTRPPVPVRCGAIIGLRVAGDVRETPLLTEALGGLCERLGSVDPELGRRIAVAAGRRAIISFGVFRRTGDDSTTLAAQPPRIVVNNRFLNGTFKGFLAPVLAHELWHAGTAVVTAADELGARRIEAAVCDLIPSSSVSRSCSDARAIVAVGADEAVRRLRASGYR
ncbi:MAG: hypothetical protein ABR520_09175 [Mycobacteriales bacterium]|nr:hypothetical protein [Frankia sp.]